MPINLKISVSFDCIYGLKKCIYFVYNIHFCVFINRLNSLFNE